MTTNQTTSPASAPLTGAAADSLRMTGRVLVATDGSPESDAALAMARLLRDHGASVDLLAVLEPMVVPAVEMPLDWASLDDARTAEMRQQVDAQAARLLGGTPADRTEVVSGFAAAVVAKRARERRARMVITGVRRHAPLDRLLLRGDTPLEIARASRTPVLVVPRAPDHMPRVVVLATDLDDATVNAARLARPLLAEAQVVHVVHARRLSISGGAGTVAGLDELYYRLITDHVDRVVAALALPRTVRVETRTLSGHPVSEILQFAELEGADLIVAGYRRRMLMDRLVGPRSVAERVYRATSCPMLLVPESATDPGDRGGSDTEGFADESQWARALSSFTVRNQGRPAHLEVDTADLGAQAMVSGFPFQGADFEPAKDTVHLNFGDPDHGRGHLAHAIRDPRSIEVRRAVDGRDIALRIGHPGGYTLLRLL